MAIRLSLSSFRTTCEVVFVVQFGWIQKRKKQPAMWWTWIYTWITHHSIVRWSSSYGVTQSESEPYSWKECLDSLSTLGFSLSTKVELKDRKAGFQQDFLMHYLRKRLSQSKWKLKMSILCLLLEDVAVVTVIIGPHLDQLMIALE